ncbi:hypothetical protein N7G274_007236 [Stereocaulon virgatum]|uniref:Uncharacterized protein n=1 Tax=Stereocaulon virgatum TaxID=373712 RepID=A0ABR4A312_9LECA
MHGPNAEIMVHATRTRVDQEVNQSSIYYLSRMNKRDIDEDHTSCSLAHFVLDELDHRIYRTMHTDECRGSNQCSVVNLDSPTWILLTDIFPRCQVPLLTAIEMDVPQDINIKVTTGDEEFTPPEPDIRQADIIQGHRRPVTRTKPYVRICCASSERVLNLAASLRLQNLRRTPYLCASCPGPNVW